MANIYLADQNKVVMFYESGTYATRSGAGHWTGQITEHEIEESENVEVLRYVGRASRNVGGFVRGAKDVEGTITYYPQDWRMLVFALGSNVDAGTGPYTHRISETNNNVGNAMTSGTTMGIVSLPSFNLEESQTSAASNDNFVRNINGCMVEEMTIKGSEGDVIECEVSYRAQSVGNLSSGAATAVTESTLRPFMWDDVTVEIPNGTAWDEIKEFEVTITNNLDAKHYLNGSRVVALPKPTNRDYELSLTMDANTSKARTLYEAYFISGNTFNMIINVNCADAGAGSRTLEITFSGCKLTEMSNPLNAEDVNEIEATIVPQSISVLGSDTTAKYNAW